MHQSKKGNECHFGMKAHTLSLASVSYLSPRVYFGTAKVELLKNLTLWRARDDSDCFTL